jgi:hypothetical protein
MKLLGTIRVGFDVTSYVTDQIFCIRQILEKSGSTMRQYIRLRESLRFSEEGSTVQYSYRVWSNREINQAD